MIAWKAPPLLPFARRMQPLNKIAVGLIVFAEFEQASSPSLTAHQAADILNFVVVGGGAAGIEFAAHRKYSALIQCPVFPARLHLDQRTR